MITLPEVQLRKTCTRPPSTSESRIVRRTSGGKDVVGAVPGGPSGAAASEPGSDASVDPGPDEGARPLPAAAGSEALSRSPAVVDASAPGLLNRGAYARGGAGARDGGAPGPAERGAGRRSTPSAAGAGPARPRRRAPRARAAAGLDLHASDEHALLVEVLVEALLAGLAAEARALHAAERRLGRHGQPVVDRDHAGLEPLRHHQGG